MQKLFYYLLIPLPLLSIQLNGQETNSHASGRVLSEQNVPVAGANVTIIHEPTQSKYAAQTREDGYFYLFNVKPGGPFCLTISSAGFETMKITNLFVHLTSQHFLFNNAELPDFILQKQIITLEEIVIHAENFTTNKRGIETNITLPTLKSAPSINRSFHDYVRFVPHAKVTGAGVMSIAGQNTRFNAFFIDGANNTDIQGIAQNGTNGGQTGSPPVSIEALEEINILIAPYNVQYGNFTGGSINAITRSGSNENKASAWYFFRDEKLAGRSPVKLENPDSPGEFYRPRLPHFFNQTLGAWNSGALIKNKLFYFALIEKQSEQRPRTVNLTDYQGNSHQQEIQDLYGFLENTYQFNPGSHLNLEDALIATKLIFKLDWNVSTKNKYLLSYRYNYSERIAPPLNSTTAMVFDNNGFKVPAKTHTASFEWKHFFKKGLNNRLLVTFTNQVDDRSWKGQPFPRVTIFDGIGNIAFGSEINSGNNSLNANDITLFDVFNFIKKKHVFTAGLDMNYSKLVNSNIPNYFGLYQFSNLNDFITGAFPSRYQRSFSLQDEGARFNTVRISFFINDEIRMSSNLKFNFGMRVDRYSITGKTKQDRFFNDTAFSIISQYYDLDDATSGSAMNTQNAFSPRIGIEYKIPGYDMIIKGGSGIFVGHIINLWPFDVYNSGIGTIDINPQQYGLHFMPDPYSQPSPSSLNIDSSNTKGALHIMGKSFKYPAVFRSSITIEKRIIEGWTFSLEGVLSKNIHEAVFRSVNILPPESKSSFPDSRNIYSINPAPAKIPLKANGINPYANIYLLTNNHDRKGNSYSISFIINRQGKHFLCNGSYTYARSYVLFEMTGIASSIAALWRNSETVNGRNFMGSGTSDNDLQHRITTFISKRMSYSKGHMTTTISLFYNGQSGSPFSYVYNGSMVNDNGLRDNFDLIYIPTVKDLETMSFVSNNTGSVTYSPEQQKFLLNDFIINDKYLKKHRGEFAERNGARLPFTNIIDLRIQQDFTIKVHGKPLGMSISFDIFNFTNLINKKWGRVYNVVNDNFPLIAFAGYSSTVTLTPQYKYTPLKGKPYSLQSSSIPGNSARWISQLGLKINFH